MEQGHWQQVAKGDNGESIRWIDQGKETKADSVVTSTRQILGVGSKSNLI